MSHPNISARLKECDDLPDEFIDLNSTNGSYVNNQPVNGVARVPIGSEVRFSDIRFYPTLLVLLQ